MGYHLKQIKKGIVGDISKLIEEIEEFKDAMDQNCRIMMEIELSDIYGALEELTKNHNLTMEDLKTMSDITKRAFKDGSRK